MKKILLLGAMLVMVLTLSAQRQMQVWQNGVPTSFAVAEVDSVTFYNESTTSSKGLLLGYWECIDSSTKMQMQFLDNDTILYKDTPYGTTVPAIEGLRLHMRYEILEDSMVVQFEPGYCDNKNCDNYYEPYQYVTAYSVVDSILTLSKFSPYGRMFKTLRFIKKEKKENPLLNMLLGNWRNNTSDTLRILIFSRTEKVTYYEKYYRDDNAVYKTYGPWEYNISDTSITFKNETKYPSDSLEHTFDYSTNYNLTDSLLILSTFSKDGKQFIHNIEFLKEQ